MAREDFEKRNLDGVSPGLRKSARDFLLCIFDRVNWEMKI